MTQKDIVIDPDISNEEFAALWADLLVGHYVTHISQGENNGTDTATITLDGGDAVLEMAGDENCLDYTLSASYTSRGFHPEDGPVTRVEPEKSLFESILRTDPHYRTADLFAGDTLIGTIFFAPCDAACQGGGHCLGAFTIKVKRPDTV